VQSKRGKGFQQAFVHLRTEFLEGAFRLLTCLRELPLAPFAYPSAEEVAAGRFHLLSEQAGRCAASLRNTALAYAHLARCQFDIDDLSLATLQAYAAQSPPPPEVFSRSSQSRSGPVRLSQTK
jgi:hypothetical protein